MAIDRRRLRDWNPSLKLSRSRWQIEQYFQRAKDDWASTILKGEAGAASTTTSRSRQSLINSSSFSIYAPKNFWCDLGTDPASDPALAGEGERLLQLLRDQI